MGTKHLCASEHAQSLFKKTQKARSIKKISGTCSVFSQKTHSHIGLAQGFDSQHPSKTSAKNGFSLPPKAMMAPKGLWRETLRRPWALHGGTRISFFIRMPNLRCPAAEGPAVPPSMTSCGLPVDVVFLLYDCVFNVLVCSCFLEVQALYMALWIKRIFDCSCKLGQGPVPAAQELYQRL